MTTFRGSAYCGARREITSNTSHAEIRLRPESFVLDGRATGWAPGYR